MLEKIEYFWLTASRIICYAYWNTGEMSKWKRREVDACTTRRKDSTLPVIESLACKTTLKYADLEWLKLPSWIKHKATRPRISLRWCLAIISKWNTNESCNMKVDSLLTKIAPCCCSQYVQNHNKYQCTCDTKRLQHWCSESCKTVPKS